jgi:hypothetical protein
MGRGWKTNDLAVEKCQQTVNISLGKICRMMKGPQTQKSIKFRPPGTAPAGIFEKPVKVKRKRARPWQIQISRLDRRVHKAAARGIVSLQKYTTQSPFWCVQPRIYKNLK